MCVATHVHDWYHTGSLYVRTELIADWTSPHQIYFVALFRSCSYEQAVMKFCSRRQPETLTRTHTAAREFSLQAVACLLACEGRSMQLQKNCLVRILYNSMIRLQQTMCTLTAQRTLAHT
jgi:hypothetical protein